VATAALWSSIGLFACWAVIRVSRLDLTFPMVQLMAYTPYVAAVATAPVGVAVLLRRWGAATVAVVVLGVFAACVLPRTLPDEPARAGGMELRGVELRVMSANLFRGNADPVALVELVRRHRVDLLSLQELTPHSQNRLRAAGLLKLLPYGVTEARSGRSGSALFSRYPLASQPPRTRGPDFIEPRATLYVPGARPVQTEAAHPCAPTPRGSRYCWSEEIGAQQPATPSGAVRLVLGDFNSTLDHAPLRRLIATGYRDAADARGKGLIGTWPYSGRKLPPITIDHVLVDHRIGVADYSVYPVPDSDHRAVYAQLALPGPLSPSI
jgi:endonuclease/exonuclease/phosphatase (EEP) superfamily protein YafD